MRVLLFHLATLTSSWTAVRFLKAVSIKLSVFETISGLSLYLTHLLHLSLLVTQQVRLLIKDYFPFYIAEAAPQISQVSLTLFWQFVWVKLNSAIV